MCDGAGVYVGASVGAVDFADGLCVGKPVGCGVGANMSVGEGDGGCVGAAVGSLVGRKEGFVVGPRLWDGGAVGATSGSHVGAKVGLMVGSLVCGRAHASPASPATRSARAQGGGRSDGVAGIATPEVCLSFFLSFVRFTDPPHEPQLLRIAYR